MTDQQEAPEEPEPQTPTNPDGSIDIAYCPEHGLHGGRNECFECEGAVYQIPMVPVTVLQAAETELSRLRERDKKLTWGLRRIKALTGEWRSIAEGTGVIAEQTLFDADHPDPSPADPTDTRESDLQAEFASLEDPTGPMQGMEQVVDAHEREEAADPKGQS